MLAGGIYIIEDLAHSFKRHDPTSTLEFIKVLVHVSTLCLYLVTICIVKVLVEGIGMVSGDGGKEEFAGTIPETKLYIQEWKEKNPLAMKVSPSPPRLSH